MFCFGKMILFSYVLHMISIMLIYISDKKVTEISYSNFSNTSVSDLNILKPNYRHHHWSSCVRKGNLSKGRELFCDCAKIKEVTTGNFKHIIIIRYNFILCYVYELSSGHHHMHDTFSDTRYVVRFSLSENSFAKKR